MKTLETMAVNSTTKGIIPTKFVPYDNEIMKLLKNTNSVVLYSIGDLQEFEKGAFIHGKTSQWRKEQIRRYTEKGIRAIPYLHILAHAPPTDFDKEILDFAEKLKIPIQLIPLRFKTKEMTENITSFSWDFSKGKQIQKSFFDIGTSTKEASFLQYRGTYENFGNELVCRTIHPFWLRLISDNKGIIRMCHHNSETTYCGACFQGKGSITKTHIINKTKNSKK